ncbi:MAG: hypothetical protein PSW75_07255 [bacterium]|nr:hypothetical protein [bacterium]MDI1337449.1 hypothetical protein [Lacunisphaera sp.]
MRYLLGTWALLAFAAASIGLMCFRLNTDSALHAAIRQRDAMEWLRTDFHLNDGQFAAIKKLHEAYAPSCAEHCRLIQEATRMRDTLKEAGRGDASAVAAAEARVQELRIHCETAIARHVRQVAAEMSPAEGARYLALVLPKIASFDHLVAPDLHLNHPR